MSGPTHLELMAEVRAGFARTDERLLTIEREVRELRGEAKDMDGRQRQLVQDVMQAKGGIALFKWLFAAFVAAVGLVVTTWHRIAG